MPHFTRYHSDQQFTPRKRNLWYSDISRYRHLQSISGKLVLRKASSYVCHRSVYWSISTGKRILRRWWYSRVRCSTIVTACYSLTLCWILCRLGPTELTKSKYTPMNIGKCVVLKTLWIETLFPSTDAVVPTVVDNLYNQGFIPNYELGIYFEATNSYQGVSNGELTFGQYVKPFCRPDVWPYLGGTDESKYTGTITYTWVNISSLYITGWELGSSPVTSIAPASEYWGIDQSLSYGDLTLLGPGTPGIVDTGMLNLQMYRHKPYWLSLDWSVRNYPYPYCNGCLPRIHVCHRSHSR